MKKIVLLLTALFILSGCCSYGHEVKVVPINIKDTGKQIVEFVKTGNPKAEVVLIEITF